MGLWYLIIIFVITIKIIDLIVKHRRKSDYKKKIEVTNNKIPLLAKIIITLLIAIGIIEATKKSTINKSENKMLISNKPQTNRPNYSKNAPFFIQPPMNAAENIIYDMGDKFQENIRRQKYLNENPDIMDMPPGEHQNKWHKIFNEKQTCWYHKKSMKKICEPINAV